MIDDAARVVDLDESGNISSSNMEHRKLETKEDIENYIKGLL